MDICDFCSSPEVVTRFECCDFDSESKAAGVIYPETAATDCPTNLVLASKNYWAACQACALLVEKGHLDKLLRRALGEYRKQHGRVDQEDDVTKHLRRTYQLFFENRIRIDGAR